jgi:glycyl-tRNA synthetase beta chain
MSELLVELFMEEIPARMQVRAAEDFRRLVGEQLSGAGLAFSGMQAQVTPRRIALVVDGLPLCQADVREERKGPRVGAAEAAIAGFLKAAGLTGLEQAETRETDKGAFYFAVTERKGSATLDALPALLEAAIRTLPWPKSMRWGDHDFRWVRPLHTILALFDGQIVPGRLDLGGGKILPFGNVTQGHRFLAPAPFIVANCADYQAKLRAAQVILDREERKRSILSAATSLADAEGLRLKDDPGLLEEVVGLVENPVALMGAIDQRFMDIPGEVLTTSMRTHQRYFALETSDGTLAPHFIVISNRPTSDGGKMVRAGNERVLRARLSDAKFFWENDIAIPLEDRLTALAQITFHEKLGDMRQRTARVEALARGIAGRLGLDTTTTEHAVAAARLAKCDLVTGIVGEFPEVQGVMGRYTALHQGLPAPVAEAIGDHYKPLGPSDDTPGSPAAAVVALADKLDSLAAFFSIGEKPTGSRDPFALRRAALGVIRILVEKGLRLPLEPVLQAAGASEATVEELLGFFHDRLKTSLKDKGVRHDLIDAALATGQEDDLVRLLARVGALADLLKSDDGANLLAAARRAINILRIEEKKDGLHAGPVDAKLLRLPAEAALHQALHEATAAASPLLAREDYQGAMSVIAGLRPVLDAFFDRVTVNDPDPQVRANRLRLLAGIRAALAPIADFTRIEG